MTAALLSLFLGSFGVQFFYMNQPKLGVAALILLFTGLSTLIGIMIYFCLVAIDDPTFDDLMLWFSRRKNKA